MAMTHQQTPIQPLAFAISNSFVELFRPRLRLAEQIQLPCVEQLQQLADPLPTLRLVRGGDGWQQRGEHRSLRD
ncbi:hypothetical protein D3C85_882470 [compost metagenome]